MHVMRKSNIIHIHRYTIEQTVSLNERVLRAFAGFLINNDNRRSPVYGAREYVIYYVEDAYRLIFRSR